MKVISYNKPDLISVLVPALNTAEQGFPVEHAFSLDIDFEVGRCGERAPCSASFHFLLNKE